MRNAVSEQEKEREIEQTAQNNEKFPQRIFWSTSISVSGDKWTEIKWNEVNKSQIVPLQRHSVRLKRVSGRVFCNWLHETHIMYKKNWKVVCALMHNLVDKHSGGKEQRERRRKIDEFWFNYWEQKAKREWKNFH